VHLPQAHPQQQQLQIHRVAHGTHAPLAKPDIQSPSTLASTAFASHALLLDYTKTCNCAYMRRTGSLPPSTHYLLDQHHLQERYFLLAGASSLPLSCCRCTAALTTVLSHNKELTKPSISPETPESSPFIRDYCILSKLQLEYMVTQIKYWLTIPMLSIPNHNISLKTNPYKMM